MEGLTPMRRTGTPYGTSILVVCDSPRHARGKVAKVAFYHPGPEGKWTRQGGSRPRAWQRRGDRVAAHGIKPDIVDILGPDTMAQQCRLCGARLTLWADDFLFPILDDLAAQGVSRITLRQLNLIASKKG